MTRIPNVACLLLLLFVFGATSSSSTFPKSPVIPDPSKYVDDVINHVREYISVRGLDPYDALDESLWNVNVTGKISGLSSLHRISDASVSYTEKSRTVHTKLRANDLKGQLHWKAELLHFKIDGTANVHVEDVLIELTITTKVPELNFTLEKFDIVKIGHVSTKLDVLPIFDHVVGATTEAIINLTKRFLTKIFRGQIQALVQEALDTYGIPVIRAVN